MEKLEAQIELRLNQMEIFRSSTSSVHDIGSKCISQLSEAIASLGQLVPTIDESILKFGSSYGASGIKSENMRQQDLALAVSRYKWVPAAKNFKCAFGDPNCPVDHHEKLRNISYTRRARISLEKRYVTAEIFS